MTQPIEPTDFDPLARLRGLIDESRRLREAYENRDEPEPEPVPELKRRANRNQIAPIGRLHRLLRQAYVHTDASNDASRSGIILDRAKLYRHRDCLTKTCSKCDGAGRIEPKPGDVAKWKERAALLKSIMDLAEFEQRFPLPMSEQCGKCHGSGTQLRGTREVTARPKGSSVHGSADPAEDPTGLVHAAQAGRIARRVARLNARHGIVLQAYYGDNATVSALAHAHGRLVLLYPLTETGTDLIERENPDDPWKFLAEFMTELGDQERKLDADMQAEAYQLLCDATDTWDDAVGIEVPDWRSDGE